MKDKSIKSVALFSVFKGKCLEAKGTFLSVMPSGLIIVKTPAWTNIQSAQHLQFWLALTEGVRQKKKGENHLSFSHKRL